jgi:ferrochelatase
MESGNKSSPPDLFRNMAVNEDSSPGVTGVLIANLGTPDSPEIKDVRKYLKEFLWDPRVINAPRLLWWLVLNGIILNTRPKKSAAAYKKIWTDDGSPLLSISRKQAEAIREKLSRFDKNVLVELGMRYGNPSMESALARLSQGGAGKLLVVPMYPQFSHTTTTSVEDELIRARDSLGLTQEFEMIRDYHDHHDYIGALAESVKLHRADNGSAQKLLMSFHGIPQDYADAGDPYPEQCSKTAQLLASALDLRPQEWNLGFQSRLGPKKWLTPYTDKVLKTWGRQGVTSVDVICPGFSADCLETLEEVAIEDRELFMASGGKRYAYIPCLNVTARHIDMISKLISERLQ